MKMNGFFDNFIVKLQNGRYILVIRNYGIMGKRIGYGKSYLPFPLYSYERPQINCTKAFLKFIKKLEQEVKKYEDLY
jgi:hypothetical protein